MTSIVDAISPRLATCQNKSAVPFPAGSFLLHLDTILLMKSLCSVSASDPDMGRIERRAVDIWHEGRARRQCVVEVVLEAGVRMWGKYGS